MKTEIVEPAVSVKFTSQNTHDEEIIGDLVAWMHVTGIWKRHRGVTDVRGYERALTMKLSRSDADLVLGYLRDSGCEVPAAV